MYGGCAEIEENWVMTGPISRIALKAKQISKPVLDTGLIRWSEVILANLWRSCEVRWHEWQLQMFVRHGDSQDFNMRIRSLRDRPYRFLRGSLIFVAR